jgi:hypothetical protein
MAGKEERVDLTIGRVTFGPTSPFTHARTAVVPPPRQNRLIFSGQDGRPVLVIDMERRVIEVPADVEVSEAAAAVFEALQPYLQGLGR